eukprot:TRINITY_DN898_c0_g2_i1.p1 TRINITY_DN898_c0_g2~~TRINITY_DN898_c0_g2_i1.p1  ORF type:complete len:655 (-),score=150.50 TRINITY_DN898_c0_g2_i1:1598-3460(-)
MARKGRARKTDQLGKAITNATKSVTRFVNDRVLANHTTDLDDATSRYQSVLEVSDLSEFVHDAILDDRSFAAERQTVVIEGDAVPQETQEDEEARHREEESHQKYLKVPRRPRWDKTTTAEQLDKMEREQFLVWRRALSQVEQNEHLTLTPFEKNLEVWRQLWRVLERSDIVVQIVDARNPLLYQCADVPAYVNDIDPKKKNVLLINKADFLPEDYRRHWWEYFESQGMHVLFFSANAEVDRLLADQQRRRDEELQRQAELEQQQLDDASDSDEYADSDDDEDQSDEVAKKPTAATTEVPAAVAPPMDPIAEITPRWRVISREELLLHLKWLGTQRGISADTQLTVGMVGYPNVGKSTTINALAGDKRVGVSATPGKTKHFQTIGVDFNIMLCDCPGLVFPSYVATKADMVCNGILPIDQMREFKGPVQIVCNRIPRDIINGTYGVLVPPPQQHEPQDRLPLASEVLSEMARGRGFMTSHGVPDESRAARLILKDYVNGKILWCSPPPNMPGATGVVPQPAESKFIHLEQMKALQAAQGKIVAQKQPTRRADTTTDVEQSFFNTPKTAGLAHTAGKYGRAGFTRVKQPYKEKPQKQKKHGVLRMPVMVAQPVYHTSSYDD